MRARLRFWDLFVAISNVFEWHYLIVPDIVVNYDRFVSAPQMWKTPLRQYMTKTYHSAQFAAIACRVFVTLKAIKDPVPGKTYPYLISGDYAAPAEDLLDSLIGAMRLKPTSPLGGLADRMFLQERPFDPSQVSFDDPEELWVEHYCEEMVICDWFDKIKHEHIRTKDGLTECSLLLPDWFRSFLGRYLPLMLPKAADDAGHPGFFILSVNSDELEALADGVQLMQFQSQDLRLNRRLQRLLLHLQVLVASHIA